MTIETKYNIGDEVWFMLCDEPELTTVEAIKVSFTRNMRYLDYYVVPKDSTVGCYVEEGSLHSTKEELLKSL